MRVVIIADAEMKRMGPAGSVRTFSALRIAGPRYLDTGLRPKDDGSQAVRYTGKNYKDRKGWRPRTVDPSKVENLDASRFGTERGEIRSDKIMYTVIRAPHDNPALQGKVAVEKVEFDAKGKTVKFYKKHENPREVWCKSTVKEDKWKKSQRGRTISTKLNRKHVSFAMRHASTMADGSRFLMKSGEWIAVRAGRVYLGSDYIGDKRK